MEDRDIYDLGLQADLAMFTRTPIARRQILKMGAVGIGLLLAGCGANATLAHRCIVWLHLAHGGQRRRGKQRDIHRRERGGLRWRDSRRNCRPLPG